MYEALSMTEVMSTPYPNPEDYPTVQQELLAFAEAMWGPQFPKDGDGKPVWWSFSEIDGISTGDFAGITNGKDYYTVSKTHTNVKRWLISEAGDMCGIEEIKPTQKGKPAIRYTPIIFY